MIVKKGSIYKDRRGTYYHVRNIVGEVVEVVTLSWGLPWSVESSRQYPLDYFQNTKVTLVDIDYSTLAQEFKDSYIDTLYVIVIKVQGDVERCEYKTQMNGERDFICFQNKHNSSIEVHKSTSVYHSFSEFNKVEVNSKYLQYCSKQPITNDEIDFLEKEYHKHLEDALLSTTISWGLTDSYIISETHNPYFKAGQAVRIKKPHHMLEDTSPSSNEDCYYSSVHDDGVVIDLQVTNQLIDSDFDKGEKHNKEMLKHYLLGWLENQSKAVKGWDSNEPVS